MAYESVDATKADQIRAYQPLQEGLSFINDNVEKHFALEMIHYFFELKVNAKD